MLLLAALLVTSCGASHRPKTSGADTSQRTVTSRTVPSEPKYSHLALISARSGEVLHISDLDVSAAVADGRGGWFVNGGIGLAHLLPNGKLDSAWGTSASRNLIGCHDRLVKSGSRLYVPGSQPDAAAAAVGERGPCGVEAFDAGTGARLWVSPSFAQTQNPIYTLTASPTRVYVGGDFIKVGNAKRQGLAALDAKTGRLLDWRGPPLRGGSPGSASVSALALAGSRLYIGGTFDSIGGKRRYYLAALNPSTGALLPWKPRGVASQYYPLEILVARGQLIVPGYDGFAATNLRTGHELPWRTSIRGDAGTVAIDGSLLYLGANIEHTLEMAGGAPRYNLAAVDLASGRVTSWAPNIGLEFVDVGEIVPSGKQVLVVGYFTDSIG